MTPDHWQGNNMFAIYPHLDGKGTATGGQFKADDSPAGYMMLSCSVQLSPLSPYDHWHARKKTIRNKGTTTGGQFKVDDSSAGYMLLPCSVQLGKLKKL
ncbi:hypothetical protein HID58_006602 [Brassica napus]|uniref:Uncharacterized protein n=1 Tax=Brassica napus TaxID=3708 RepID=A0ABQ8EEW4_BRANA|nr:hypothetical protein HID58_006602 [Brassica napus]